MFACVGAAVLAAGAALADQKGVVGAAAGETTIAALFLPLPPADSVESTAASFDLSASKHGYDLDSVRNDGGAVPRLFLARLPTDLPAVESHDARKVAFIKMLLPLVLAENERIFADRQRLLALRDVVRDGGAVAAPDRHWITALAGRYEIDTVRTRDVIGELVKRVDVVPPSLALGQAALESGWGTSAGAQRKASTFGMMVFASAGERSWVRKFEELAHGVEAYALNLNTHKAYTRFRVKRAEMRNRGAAPDGNELALMLASYSERKMDYVRDIRGIIKANKLKVLDAAQLGG